MKWTSWLNAASVLGRQTTFTPTVNSICCFQRWWLTSRHVLYGLYFSIWCPIYILCPYPPDSAAYSFPWEKIIHCFSKAHPLTLVTLCWYIIWFSCSLARWQLSFHFKKVEVKGIVLILLQLQEFFLVKLKERSLLANHFLFPCYWQIHVFSVSTGWKCLFVHLTNGVVFVSLWLDL